MKTLKWNLLALALVGFAGCGGDKDGEDDTDTEGDTDTDTDTDSDTDADADTDSDTDTDTDADTDTDTGTPVTDTAPYTYDLMFTGTNYQNFQTQTIHFALKDNTAGPKSKAVRDSLVVSKDGTDADADGTNETISATWTNVLMAGSEYTLAWFIDGNGDGNCTPPEPSFMEAVGKGKIAGDEMITGDFDLLAVNPVACQIMNGP